MTNYQQILKEAQTLRENEYTLLMFDLREKLEAEPDSIEKWRALGQVYYGLALYQSAYDAYGHITDPRERWKKTDHEHLQHMAKHFGDARPKARPLPITPELKAGLPTFRYCPDPLGAELLGAQENPIVCDCCGASSHVFYSGPFYTEHEDSLNFCPTCIADGAAADKFDGEFIDMYDPPPGITDEQTEILTRRTPSYSGWQQEAWPHHCQDYCEFIAYVSWQDIENMGLTDKLAYTDDVPSEFLDRITRFGSLRGYLFRCTDCRQYVLHSDFD